MEEKRNEGFPFSLLCSALSNKEKRKKRKGRKKGRKTIEKKRKEKKRKEKKRKEKKRKEKKRKERKERGRGPEGGGRRIVDSSQDLTLEETQGKCLKRENINKSNSK